MKFLPSSTCVVVAAATLFFCAISTGFTAALSASAATGKKIFLAFDGSGENPDFNGPNKDADFGFSNVYKLHLLVGGSCDPENTQEKIPNQKSLYVPGVGGFSRFWIVRKFRAGLVGDLKQQTRPMKKMLEEIYEEGDQLYLCGFSRGASSARKFAVDLHRKGIRTASGTKVKEVPIECLVCFDTVSVQTWTGWFNPIKRYRFYKSLFTKSFQKSTVLGEKGGQLPPNIKKAVHNLSLDDERAGTFSPVPMDSKDDRVHEVWFPGVHSDVGGGWYIDGISNVSGRYVQKFLADAGLDFLKPEEVIERIVETPRGKIDFTVEPRHVAVEPADSTDLSHVSVLGVPQTRPIMAVSENKAIEDGTVRIHESFLERIQSDSPMQNPGAPVPYKINPNLAKTKFVVVGDFNEELAEKTEELTKALQDRAKEIPS